MPRPPRPHAERRSGDFSRFSWHSSSIWDGPIRLQDFAYHAIVTFKLTPVCLVCRLVVSVADEGRGNTHTHTHRTTTVTLAAHARRGLMKHQHLVHCCVCECLLVFLSFIVKSTTVCVQTTSLLQSPPTYILVWYPDPSVQAHARTRITACACGKEMDGLRTGKSWNVKTVLECN